jgi:hypothetical protein
MASFIPKAYRTHISFTRATFSDIFKHGTQVVQARYSDGVLVDGYRVKHQEVEREGTEFFFTRISDGKVFWGIYRSDGHSGLYVELRKASS